MPRVVDPLERRQLVGDAVWRVMRSRGLDGASVRAVAAEAGLATGSLRHYFARQSELQLFAMSLVVERIRARVLALPQDGDPTGVAERILCEFLPLDGERRAESEVWLAFTARSLVDPHLRARRNQAYDELRETCGWVLGTFFALAPGEADIETVRLYALLDGLLVHGVVRPAVATGPVLVRALARHLATLPSRAPSPTATAAGGAGDPPQETGLAHTSR